MAGIHRNDDAVNLFHRDRDIAGLDVCRLLHLPQLMAITGRDSRYSKRDSMPPMGSRPVPAEGRIGGIEPTGKGGCRELSSVLSGAKCRSECDNVVVAAGVALPGTGLER